MDITEIERFAEKYMAETPMNFVSEEDALLPELIGMQIYDGILVGVSAADDRLYTEEFKKPEVIHPDHRTPAEWLPGANSVISFFVSFCDDVNKSNEQKTDVPFDESIHNQRCSTKWLHARIEGQKLVNDLAVKIADYLKAQGYEAVVPAISPEFKMLVPHHKSNWSERHAAYASGLGTFGLSRGLITERGMSGRFGSIITSAKITPTERPYKTPFEYCILCGACQTHCPAKAIDKTKGVKDGKDMNICAPYVGGSYIVPWGPKQTVRYGCGKCYVKVPCEHQIPKKK